MAKLWSLSYGLVGTNSTSSPSVIQKWDDVEVVPTSAPFNRTARRAASAVFAFVALSLLNAVARVVSEDGFVPGTMQASAANRHVHGLDKA